MESPEEETVDFLKYIREDMNILKKEMEESIKSIDDALNYLTDPKVDIFEMEPIFTKKMNAVQETLHRYVKQLLKIDAQAKLAVMTQQEQPQQQQQDGGWRTKIASVFGVKQQQQQYERMQPSTNMVDMESRIIFLRKQYESHTDLLKFQDMENRREKLLNHWRGAGSEAFINILNYVRASYENEIDTYMQLRESLTKSMLTQGTHIEPEAAKK
ncbi:MAG: hypothetical protein JRN26_04750 [Nitrososphaerota archaeon]|jgi:hypothetical protein|nr:hypothetical protein [Nitrososphaerota archaeon]MDG6927832.1 hypothetical protein [Nitrososphaerota archaeon]MDG6931260.1 hypothetical protein [Nitrososphaerota archaeon]MDG6932127.1 hypothetical protein [Nitrososphaerota archaeon]MDG6936174.1 hypothetical protein [Nitrososphaerota archaeon]